MNPFPRATEQAHTWLSAHLRAGDIAIDATAGNGHDTVFLARLVGPSGQVHAFDVQAEALQETRRRLEAAELFDRVTLIEGGHETMLPRLESLREQVAVIAFNLGYLPGSDKSTITGAETTLQALEQGLHLLRPGGIITLVIYTGHEGGNEESEAVLDFCHQLDPQEFRAYRNDSLNYHSPPPYAIGIARSAGK